MKYLLLLLLLTSCDVSKFHRVVDPIEALRICGNTGVKQYSAISGNVTCNGSK